MGSKAFLDHLTSTIVDIKSQGLYKEERIITSPQGAAISTTEKPEVLNFCANNYLGFSHNPVIEEGAIAGIKRWGFGLSSVRFICGTQACHKDLEAQISKFLGTDDTILYAACFDANGGVFEPLLGPEDAIISDELNHASIIDGVRLCKAARYRYKHNNMEELEQALIKAQEQRFRMICTDGVFSMDGDMANLPEICRLAEKYDAIVLVDDSHATGYIGKTGRGTPEHFGVQDKVDIITTTFGKAMGGASGGCISGRGSVIEFLRQKSRPYLFSNTLAPAVVTATQAAFKHLDEHPEIPEELKKKADYFRARIVEEGFDVVPGNTAIVPVMLYDEILAQRMSKVLLDLGIYAIGFSYPVVPKGRARIRLQISALHTQEHLDRAVEAFVKAREIVNNEQ